MTYAELHLALFPKEVMKVTTLGRPRPLATTPLPLCGSRIPELLPQPLDCLQLLPLCGPSTSVPYTSSRGCLLIITPCPTINALSQ